MPRHQLFYSLFAAALWWAAPAAAQSDASPPPAGGLAALLGAAPEMDRLAPIAGTWQVAVESYRPRLERWDAAGNMTAHFARTFDGHFIETSLVVGAGTQGYLANMIFSWDRLRGEYRAIIRDNIIGLIDVFEGGFDGEVLMLDNRATGTAGPSMNGRVEPNRLRLHIDGSDRFVLHIDAWRGEQWVEGTRFVFSRLTIDGQ